MAIEEICRTCQRPFTPSRSDVISGVWRLCEDCRKPPATSPRPIDAPAAACGTVQNLTFLRG